jgi:hypothetical protein
MSCGQASTLTVTIFRVVGVYAASVAARLM